MVIMTHGPDTCATVDPDIGAKARNGMGQMEEASKKHDVAVQGFWVDPPAHQFYMLADAPNAHTINEFAIELQFFHWNTVEIHAVRTVDEAMPLTARE